MQKYLEENVIPLVIKKIKYTKYQPQFKLYLSHQPPDSMPFMRTFESGLKFLGYATWLDETNMPVGSNNLSAIKNAIDDSDIFVAWLNSEYMESDISLAQLRYAHSRRKVIIAFATPEVRKDFVGEFQFLTNLHVFDPHRGSFFEVLRRIDSALFDFETLTF